MTPNSNTFGTERLYIQHVALTKASLNKLRKRLPKGYRTIARERLGGKYSLQFITMNANGDRYNAEVISVLVAIAEERTQTDAHIARRINQLN